MYDLNNIIKAYIKKELTFVKNNFKEMGNLLPTKLLLKKLLLKKLLLKKLLLDFLFQKLLLEKLLPRMFDDVELLPALGTLLLVCKNCICHHSCKV